MAGLLHQGLGAGTEGHTDHRDKSWHMVQAGGGPGYRSVSGGPTGLAMALRMGCTESQETPREKKGRTRRTNKMLVEVQNISHTVHLLCNANVTPDVKSI